MDTISSILKILSPLLSVVGGAAMSGPVGAIVVGVLLISLIGGAAYLMKKWNDFKSDAANTQSQANSVDEQQKIISDNQQQSQIANSDIDKSEKEKEAAKGANP